MSSEASFFGRKLLTSRNSDGASLEQTESFFCLLSVCWDQPFVPENESFTYSKVPIIRTVLIFLGTLQL